MSRQTPYKIAKKEVPRKIVVCDKITNLVFLSLNTIPPILNGIGMVGYDAADLNGENTELANKLHQLGRISYMVTLIVPITSGIFLFTALYKINNSIRS